MELTVRAFDGAGYSTVEEHRKVGDKWIDSDGYEWEQKEGFRVKKLRDQSWWCSITNVKIVEKNCSPKWRGWDRNTRIKLMVDVIIVK